MERICESRSRRNNLLILLFVLPLLAFFSPVVAHGQPLTRRDSSQIGGQIALYFAPHLRASRGADSTNAVCVRLVSRVRGAFQHSLDSSLRRATGGALVAPRRSMPLRSIEVIKVDRFRDTVFVSATTSSGGLRVGESQSGTSAKIPVVRAGSIWSLSKVGIVSVGDGYIRRNKRVPPSPPKC